MEPLRILHLNSLLNGGGTDDQCVKLAAGLHRLGHEVWLAGPSQHEYSHVVEDSGVRLHPTPPEGPIKLRFITAAARFIRRAEIQIVHGHHGRDYWPTILAARLSGRQPKVVLSRHLAKSPASWISRHCLLNRCAAMIAVSEFVARVLRDGVYEPASPIPERRARTPIHGDPARVHVVLGGIDVEQFRPLDAAALREQWGLAPEHYAFGAIGSYDLPHGKGQRTFLRAVAEMHGEAPQARFLVVGRGSMRSILEADIERLGLRGKAWLTPYCHDMPSGMNAIDCLVHGQVGTEAFGAVVLEAFACGRPVIASALDGLPEAFASGGAGALVTPDSVAELAAALRQCALRGRLTPSERKALHDRIASGYSIESFAARMTAVYQTLMSGHHADAVRN